MTETAGTTRFGAAVRRQWIIVVAAALIGLIAAGLLAGSKSATSWKASERVMVTGLQGGVVTDARTNVVVTAASTGSVVRSAETSLGLASGALSGKVSSAAATANNSTTIVTVSAPTRAAAMARVKAVTTAVVTYVFAPYQGFFNVQEEVARAGDAQAKVLQASIDSLTKTAQSVPVVARGTYYQAIVAAATERDGATADAQTARTKINTMRASVYVDPAVTASKVSSRLRLSGLVQGLLLGIIAGLAIAMLREWLRTRPKAA